MAGKRITKSQFKKALEAIGRPSGGQLKFLQAHFSSPGKASTATELAHAAGYKTYDGVNLQYGILARKVSQFLEIQDGNLGVLLEFSRPDSLTNAHWILSMRAEFAEALLELGWVKRR